MKKLILAASLLSMTLWAYAQRQIVGVVVDDETKEPLIGATVREPDTGNGSITDISGRFSFTVNEGTSITVQYVGYQLKTVPIDNDKLYITLTPFYELENVLIRGVRANADDPVSKTTVSKEVIKEEYVGEHPIFLMERLSPSIFSYSESGTSVGNYGQIRLRGIGQERINFTLNGAPLNDMIDHGVFFSNFTDITSSFESIQVQRGVGTTATGASSYAGSINMESFNVSGSEAFSQVQIGAGSYNTYRTNFSVNTGVNENNIGFYSSYSRLWSDGFRDNTFSDASSFFLTGGYYGEKDLVRITAFSGNSKNGLGYYTIDQSILDNDPTFNNLTENDTDDFSQYMVQLQYSHKFSSQLSLSNTAYYGGAGGDFAEGTPDVDSVFVENYFGPYQTSFFSINYPLKNDHFGWISNLFYKGDRLDLSAGVHGYVFYRENREAILPDNANPYIKDQTTKKEIAVFTKANYDLTEQLSIYADLQFRTMRLEFMPDYGYINGGDLNAPIVAPMNPQNDFQFFNPRLGLKYEINPGLSTYASFGRSGREPTRVDLIGGFTLGGDALQVLRNTTFEPEFVNDLEIGLNLSKQKLALSSNVFYMSFENEIAPLGEVIAFGVQRRVNIDQSTRYGWETDWNYLFAPSLSFRGNLSVMQSNISTLNLNGEVVSDVQQILTPNVIARAGLSWRSANNQVKTGIDINHMSESFMDYTNDQALTVPSFTTTDLSVGYYPNDMISIQLQVRNLTNLTYYTYGTPSDVDFSGTVEPGFFAQAPRNFFLTTSFTF
ncbi:MAG: iron complex outermembrane receptor protein [Paraglaciecola sp.]|jgi:iron complex outermembrane receptor protein